MTDKEKSALQKEIVESCEIGQSGRWILAPRVGKTRIAVLDIKRNKPTSILWVSASQELLDNDIPNEFEKWGAKSYLKKLTTSTWMSLHNVKGHFDMIILDEEQFATPTNMFNLLAHTLTYRILRTMTGTESKHENKLSMYESLGLEILYKIDINQAVNIGLLSNYTIKVVKVWMNTKLDIEVKTKTGKFMTSELKQYMYLTKIYNDAIETGKNPQFPTLNRMRAIKNSPAKREAAKELAEIIQGRKMIFCGSIAQAEEISEHFYHSKSGTDSLNKFKKGDIDSIAMVNAGGVGHTYKEIDDLIMVQVDSDRNGLTSQKLARALLKQKNKNITIWILMLENTKDENWVKSTLENFDSSKIEYIDFKEFKNYVKSMV